MIRQGLTRVAVRHMLAGDYSEGDRYRMALYTHDADLGADTTSYTGDEEVVGVGYESSGKDVPGWKIEEAEKGARLTFDALVWPDSTIKARGALIYNDSLPGMPSVAVLDFEEDVISTNGPFRVRAPKSGVLVWEV